MSRFVLADTSIWISHLRGEEKHLVLLLEQGFVVSHPFIVGELACGSLKKRGEFISLLEALPVIDILEHVEVMEFIESRQLMSKGIGYIDIHLLGSSVLSNTPLWTFDKSLKKAATLLRIAYND